MSLRLNTFWSCFRITRGACMPEPSFSCMSSERIKRENKFRRDRSASVRHSLHRAEKRGSFRAACRIAHLSAPNREAGNTVRWDQSTGTPRPGPSLWDIHPRASDLLPPLVTSCHVAWRLVFWTKAPPHSALRQMSVKHLGLHATETS